ncbi:acyl-CoA N-acyltransferase [Halteromyces radiatus]|uniref:acyl-CoA N-acyltransferase n=1 Tax=Halteromyces radiatus TaxID=101107 RepID=UPI002220C78C|nr:acyl-CoA N-acyltransferase [Halteromyces radiatus]KAI8081680.1 acyl-CoA N-acyltransferase [Halteromyces radiatus]
MTNKEKKSKQLNSRSLTSKVFTSDDNDFALPLVRSKRVRPISSPPRKRTRSITETTIPTKSSHPHIRARTPPLPDTEIVRPRNVEKVVYGRYEIDAWYYSPYPHEFGSLIKRLYVCDTCLRYVKDDIQLSNHKAQCQSRTPPGRVVYATDKVKIYEIDGRDNKMYCQNLCLMAKLFLDHKTLYYDVDGFKFYVLTERQEKKPKDLMVGYFSKEKISYDNYNLACIMTLPSHQRKGYGRLLIEWSYELSKREGVIGSPEKPLSTLGLLGYHSYWSSVILQVLKSLKESEISIARLCQETYLQEEDVTSTLARLGLLRHWEHPPSSLVSNNPSPLFSISPPPVVVHIDPSMLNQVISKHHIHFNRQIDPSCILL